MKVTAIGTRVVNARMRNWVFVKVETDEGVTGWGEASLEWKTRGVVGCVEDLAPLVVGQDPRRIEHLYQTMYRHSFFRMGIVGMSALSGIEQACWDIWGQSLGVPVYQLLGGAVRDALRVYDHLGGGEMTSIYLDDLPERMAEHARASVAAGFTAIKALVVPITEPLTGTAPLRHAERCLAAIRHAVGDDVDILVDLHGRTTPAMAIQYAQILSPFRPYWFEEPCPPENISGMAQVARAIPHPRRHRRADRDPLRLPRTAGAGSLRHRPARPLPLRRPVGSADNCRDGGSLLGGDRPPPNPLGPIATARQRPLRLRHPQLPDSGGCPRRRPLAQRGRHQPRLPSSPAASACRNDPASVSRSTRTRRLATPSSPKSSCSPTTLMAPSPTGKLPRRHLPPSPLSPATTAIPHCRLVATQLPRAGR